MKSNPTFVVISATRDRPKARFAAASTARRGAGGRRASRGGSRAEGRTDHQEKELALSAWTDETNDHGSPLIDLQGLQKVFDTNHDGVLDSQDARWNEFRVRHDLNQNCGVDESELRTMSEAGIKLIALIP